MPALTKDELAAVENSISQYRASNAIVVKRIKEIITIILDCYGCDCTVMWWDFSGRDRDYGDGGNLADSWGSTINVVVDAIGAIKIDVAEFPDELSNIPKEWLTTADNKIVDEVMKFINDIRDEQKAKIADKAKKAASKVAKKKAKEEVLKKLTPEEREILGAK